ncbi:MAG: hydroxylamine reductase [Acidobacteriia bacterium]|nr:hydroxylamine reductase [Terriglobia bacterium]
MFCYQCEQAAKGEGCTVLGVCGKQPEVAALQDLLIYSLQGLSLVAVAGRQVGVSNREVNVFTCKACFSTLTNVDFDPQRFVELIHRSVQLRESLKAKVKAAGGQVDFPKGPATFKPEATLEGMLEQAEAVGLKSYPADSAMELLDAGNTGRYGHPVPTQVPLGHKKGKAILVSGHDLLDLEEILKASEGKGIYVYTHGEMLPTHGYPGLKKYAHFYGHYGTAWQNQAKEFPKFPGAIVMTTNCLQRPQEVYADNLFTTGLVGWPGITHIKDHNFQPVIDKALALPGFPEDTDGPFVMAGFARNAVMSVANQVIEAVKHKKIRHFFLVGGCDGAKPTRNYYTEFVEKVPKDCVVLTLACGKFRFFDKEMGDIGGIPRLLDIGQCNDAYSAVQIAVALAQAFNMDVNELPLSLILSWYEQKAVAILLSLLYLGIKNMRLGPSLPAFVTPNVLEVLVKNFNIKPITTPEEDLKAILG